jgi:hypothetical protein
VTKISIATAKMTVSCGQKICPRMENRLSTMLTRRSGLPLMRIHGPANMMTMSRTANPTRRRCHTARLFRVNPAAMSLPCQQLPGGPGSPPSPHSAKRNEGRAVAVSVFRA